NWIVTPRLTFCAGVRATFAAVLQMIRTRWTSSPPCRRISANVLRRSKLPGLRLSAWSSKLVARRIRPHIPDEEKPVFYWGNGGSAGLEPCDLLLVRQDGKITKCFHWSLTSESRSILALKCPKLYRNL